MTRPLIGMSGQLSHGKAERGVSCATLLSAYATSGPFTRLDLETDRPAYIAATYSERKRSTIVQITKLALGVASAATVATIGVASGSGRSGLVEWGSL